MKIVLLVVVAFFNIFPALLGHVGIVWKSSGLSSDSFLVVCSVLAISGVCFCLCGILDVGVVEEVLNANQELLDGNGRSPILILVQQTQTHCARGVHVGVKQRWTELDFGWSGGEVFLENHVAFIKAAFPRSGLLARNGKLPLHQVQGAVWVLGGAGDESKGVVLTPLLPLL